MKTTGTWQSPFCQNSDTKRFFVIQPITNRRITKWQESCLNKARNGKNSDVINATYFLTFPLSSCIEKGMKNQELSLPEPSPNGRIYINQDCWLLNEDGCVTVFVKWFPLLSYDADDHAMARMVMVMLAESKVATQEELTRTFGVERTTLYRLRRKYQEQGPEAFVDKKRGPKGPRKTGGRLDRVIVRMKDEGKSNQKVAERLGTSENAIRRALKRLGYHPKEKAQEDIPLNAGGDEDKQKKSTEPILHEPQTQEEQGEDFPVDVSMDTDPENRDIDRLLARMGLLEDAAPMFRDARAVEGIGVLLAVPILVLHGVFSNAARAFSSLGPAFYGLRNTLLGLVFCFLRGINRPENLKEHSPSAMGKAMGLDRAPEMKTLRRKIRELAGQNRVTCFIKMQLEGHLQRLKKGILWVYIDGHVSVYSGKSKLSKHYVTKLRMSLPAVLDYWINDENGDPLLVMTGRPRKGMTGVIEETIGKLRASGDRRVITLVFDREGWSPALFARLDAMEGVRFVTYRKSSKGRKLPRLSEKEFKKHKWEVNGQKIEYELICKRVHIKYRSGRKKKKLLLRQVTRRSEDGHQTHIVTNDWDTPDVEIAYRMFSRWSQENFFKYMRERKDLDGLISYLMEEADSERLVQNPYREPLKRDLKKHRAELEKLMSRYGDLALENNEATRPTTRGFKIANVKLGREIKKKKKVIEKLEKDLKELPAKIPVRLTVGEEPKQVHTQTRRLIHAFRMVCYRAESSLRELLRGSYPRWNEESRALIRTFLNASGDVYVSGGNLLVTLDKQSSPHRTKLLACLCEALNLQKTRFPGSDLVLHFEVREGENVA